MDNNNIEINNGMILCVSSPDWEFPKHILVEVTSKEERLNEIAKDEFKKLGIGESLLDYNYFGKITIVK